MFYRCIFFITKNNQLFQNNCSENAGHLAIPGFSDIFDFAVCGGIFCTFPYDRVLFVVIFLHFAQKYRCVLKSGSRLTSFIIFLYFLQKYRCVPKIGFWADISIDILMCISIDTFISIPIVIYLTFIDNGKEKEGVDLILKSNDPTPEGGERSINKCKHKTC